MIVLTNAEVQSDAKADGFIPHPLIWNIIPAVVTRASLVVAQRIRRLMRCITFSLGRPGPVIRARPGIYAGLKGWNNTSFPFSRRLRRREKGKGAKRDLVYPA